MTLNTATLIARQYQDLAVRMVHESKTLSPKTKQHFFRNLLYSDEGSKREKYGTNGGCKTQQWFVKSVFGTSDEDSKEFNRSGHLHISQAERADPFQGFSSDGHVSDVKGTLTALPDDPYVESLYAGLFKSDEITGNIILAARRLWCQGFDGNWNEYPETPSSCFLTNLIEELCRQLDRETATNITTNFLSYQQRYLSKRMESLPFVDTHVKDKLAELFAYLIDILPLDGRPDLVKLKDDLAVDSVPQFMQFIIQERQELASMMGVKEIFEYDTPDTVDDEKVDMRLALGFGDHKCIQTDFLIPAILSMGRKAGMAVTLIPKGGTCNRTLLFNSIASNTFMNNLRKLAAKFRMDIDSKVIEVANNIEKKYKEAMKGIDGDSIEYDLRKLSFLIDVSITKS